MTQEHPITPPPELVKKWHDDWLKAKVKHVNFDDYISTQAARWGADQELEACVEWMNYNCPNVGSHHLTAARRPKPQSLKEQALALIDGCNDPHGDYLDDAALDTIRRALEQLDD